MKSQSRSFWASRLGVCLIFACLVIPIESQAQPVAKQQLAEGITFEVNALRRINDKVLQMDFTVVNGSTKPVDPGNLGLSYAGSMSAVNLLDMQNLKLHSVGNAGAAGCLCSKKAKVPAKGRQTFYAQYAAPPAGVTKMAIKFAVAPPLFDVPISQ